MTATARTILFLMFVALIILAVDSGCRDKKGPVGPDSNGGRSWKIVLRNAPVFYHHYNDTITVRVYDTLGHIANGIEVRSTCGAGLGNVSPQVFTTSDTITKPWGTQSALIYSGIVDAMDSDVVHSWAIQNETDTLAHTSTSFHLTQHP
jgi:hypothetical protein